jgi:hypothetical protein
MTSESPEQWLTREVADLLDAGSVGLYELLWLLNGADFQLVDAEKKAIAYKVAKGIVGSGRANLYELAWPSGEIVSGPADLATRIANADAWPTEASEQYLALLP